MTITQTKPNKIINPESANAIIEVADEIIYSNYPPGVEFKLKVQPLTMETTSRLQKNGRERCMPSL